MARAEPGDQITRETIARGWERHRQDPEEALVCARQALADATTERSRIDALCLLSAIYHLRAYYTQARDNASQAQKLARTLPDSQPLPLLQATYRLAVVEMTCGEYDSALQHLERVQQQARTANDPRLALDALAAIGQIYHWRGDFARALEHAREVCERSQELEYIAGEAIARLRMGTAYDRFGDYASALEQHHHSLQLWETIADTVGRLMALGNIGNIYISLQEPDTAIPYIQQSLELSRQCQLPVYEAMGVSNLGIAYFLKGELEQAEQYHRQAMTLHEGLGNLHALSTTLGNLGKDLIRQGKLTEGIEVLNRSGTISRQLQDRHGLIQRLVTLAEARQKLPESDDQPLACLQEALTLAETSGSSETLALVYEALYQYHKARTEMAEALHYHEKYTGMRMTIYNEEVARRTRLMQTLHNVEQTRKEAEIHRLRTIELAEALAEAERQRQIAEKRMENELAIAAQIQRSMVPILKPEGVIRPGYEISGIFQPARLVGGDLYDFIPLGPERLCLVMGDVADKGIPAALLMARTVTLIRMVAARATSPVEILTAVNQELCANNDECLFVTLFCGILNLETGAFQYASAGHDPALLLRHHQAAPLTMETGPAIGLDASARFPAFQTLLQPGDFLVLYTDGFTEAMNPQADLLAEKRLQAALQQRAFPNAPAVVAALETLYTDFVGIAPQSDDRSILVLRYLR